MDEGLGSLREA